jgi:hypothetical protein
LTTSTTFLPQFADVAEELALALGERPIRRGHEQHQIGARNESARQQLVRPLERVRARRVDEVDVAQQRRAGGDAANPVVPRCAVLLVGDHLDFGGGRRHAFAEDRRAHERVDERALPGVEFTDDDQEEELVELVE